jgi:hypothetical protein
VSEPRVDLARVDGLARIRYRVVAGQLDLPPGRLLTAAAFMRAGRRVAEIPAQSAAQLRLRPLPEGNAQLDVAVLERPLLFGGPLEAGGMGVRALIERAASLRLASPTGNGELWTASVRWRTARPRAALLLAIPAGAGRPGVWRVEGSWERQSYALDAGVRREKRRRSALSFSDWIAPDVRLEAGTALDRWSGRGTHVALETRLDVRLAEDRLALGAQGGQWTSLERGPPFRAGSIEARWGPRRNAEAGWSARAGVFHATARAPLALWPGAGTGSGRESLLRAHPLLEGGVVAGRGFGRSLVDAGLEREGWARTIASLRLGWSVFVDTARPTAGLRAATAPRWLVDGGVSLRAGAPGGQGTLRLTAAHGFVDGTAAFSVGWEVR